MQEKSSYYDSLNIRTILDVFKSVKSKIFVIIVKYNLTCCAIFN